jgi:tellurite resistance protein TerA
MGAPMAEDEPLFLPPTKRSGFRRRTMRIDPGERRPFLASEWQDCLVVIESGQLDLEAASGARHTCRGGDILWLAGLPLSSLSNQGDQPVVITTVRRRPIRTLARWMPGPDGGEPMTERLTKGGNTPWPHERAVVAVTGLPTEASVLAFLVGADGRVRSDDDFVFFNNPTVPGVAISDHRTDLDLTGLPDDVEKVVIAAVQDDRDPAALSAHPLGVTVDPGDLTVPMTGLTSERAVVLVEVYRRAGGWKIRNVSAGWTEGFAALVRAHGVEVDEQGPAPEAAPDRTPAAAQPPATPAPAPAINLRKPGIDAVDLGKRTGTINLRKGEQVTITKTPRIVATCTWPRATDYDIYALVRYRDGRTETVSTFGTRESPKDFRLATGDGAVRHSGDIGRSQAQRKGWRRKAADQPAVGQETIEINLNPQIAAVVPVVYSAQSNGTGSFRRYQVSMAIDNGSVEHGGGDTVTIGATNASDDDTVFTCVPGIIINDADGVRIQFLEFYSAQGSEHRPVVGDDLIVAMDAGPVNAFK